MATATKEAPATKATPATTSKTQTPSVVITPAVQRLVKVLRSKRDEEKLAKELASEARDSILEAFGEVVTNTYGTDAKGKRLVSIKLLDSSERIEWSRLAEEDPELYQSVKALLAPYTVGKGEGKPTVRVDVL
jgi:hypothetical protein